MKYEAISHSSSLYSVRKMCRVLGLNPSNYYRWIKNEEMRKIRMEEERTLVRRVEQIFKESDKTYGYRAMKKALEEAGIELSEYRIRRFMRENGMYPETRTKNKLKHNGKVNGCYYRNLLQQNFKTEKKNQVWVGDITYIKTNMGWIYLAAVMDLYNREIIGYSIVTAGASMRVKVIKK